MDLDSKIEIYNTAENNTEIKVQFDADTVWLTQAQMVELFQKNKRTISEHINNVFSDAELERISTVRKFRTVQTEGKRKVVRNLDHYNLDVIISVGYRVKSKRGTQFRQWATQRLKDYLVQGYAINEKRLSQKEQQVEYLKTGIRILNRAIEQEAIKEESEMLNLFAKGLELLDDFDHENLDIKGKTLSKTVYPNFNAYMKLIEAMCSEFKSGVFAQPKDDSFNSSINQIRQSFNGKDLYPSLEEKAANLLYFITKNHSFVDGNKRIAAACFLYFLQQNKALFNKKSEQIISSEALASLTIFIASSESEESETVKKLTISILNRNK